MWHKSFLFILLILFKYTIKNPPVAIGIAIPEDFLSYKQICLINILKIRSAELVREMFGLLLKDFAGQTI